MVIALFTGARDAGARARIRLARGVSEGQRAAPDVTSSRVPYSLSREVIDRHEARAIIVARGEDAGVAAEKRRDEVGVGAFVDGMLDRRGELSSTSGALRDDERDACNLDESDGSSAWPRVWWRAGPIGSMTSSLTHAWSVEHRHVPQVSQIPLCMCRP
jgi:hypothetical protein